MLPIAVELADQVSNTGEFVADARALEAAGADGLWIGDRGTLDPWVRLGALAATTYRTSLGILDLELERRPRPILVAALATLERLAPGRIRVGAHDPSALAELRAVLPESIPVLLVASAGDAAGRWMRVPSPANRDEWRRIRAAHGEAGAAGLIVAMSPRLLDLLRNPDSDDDRSDLRIAVG